MRSAKVRNSFRSGRSERGQTAVEYMLGIAVVAIAISVTFIYMSDSTKDIFNNARKMIELPYP